jgi:hypothetical protein
MIVSNAIVARAKTLWKMSEREKGKEKRENACNWSTVTFTVPKLSNDVDVRRMTCLTRSTYCTWYGYNSG